VVGVAGLGSVPVPGPAHLAARGLGGNFRRPALTAIESERADWIITSKGGIDDAIAAHCDRLAGLIRRMEETDAQRTAARIEWIKQRNEAQERRREALEPGTRVNNCTPTPTLDALDRRQLHTSAGAFAPLKVHRRKLGRFFNWGSKAGGPSFKGDRDESVGNP
jgi:hypothetical protein